tara:strand:+ start:7758 stop:8696 length:939 start_codon:yes stop_codon:yes gene_type:complete
MKNPSILFIGSKDIGYHCLNELIKGKENIVGAICRHDDPHEKQWYKSVSGLAIKNNLKVYKPKDINEKVFVEEIKKLNPDFIICVQYPKIFKKDLLDVPKFGSINLHFAPLPKYRGCYPIAWAIINDEKEFGITMHFMDSGVDNGDIIAQEMFEIKDNDSGCDLYNRCTQKGLELFRKTLPVIKSENIPRHKQDNSQAIKYDRKVPYNRTIDLDWKARKVYNFIRALYFFPFEPAFTFYNKEKIHILQSKILEDNIYGDRRPGEIVEITKEGFIVKAIDACLLILKIDDKNKIVNPGEYLLSRNIRVRSILG